MRSEAEGSAAQNAALCFILRIISSGLNGRSRLSPEGCSFGLLEIASAGDKQRNDEEQGNHNFHGQACTILGY